MIETVQRLWRARSMTLIFIEHDMDIVFKVAQSVRVLSYGAVLAEGTPDEIRRSPAVIEAWCRYCLISAGVTLLLFLSALALHRSTRPS